MQVHLNEEERQKEMELEAYDKIKQEELEERCQEICNRIVEFIQNGCDEAASD